MIPKEFKQYFQSLDEDHRQEIVNELSQMIGLVRDTLPSPSGCTHCPHCESHSIIAKGTDRDQQRYRCKDCGKCFRETTGMAFHGLKKRELLPTYLYHLLKGSSIQDSAQGVGISTQTSFDWRHKILASLQEVDLEVFKGIVEGDELFLAESQKGSRSLDRKPRKRGGITGKGISDDHVAVVATCDRSGNICMKVAGRGRVTKAAISRTIGRRTDKNNILCSDAHTSYTAFAKQEGMVHHTLNASKGERVKDKIYHIQHANNLCSRFRKWIGNLGGVATKYLQNYLNWFVALETLKKKTDPYAQMDKWLISDTNSWNRWKLVKTGALS